MRTIARGTAAPVVALAAALLGAGCGDEAQLLAPNEAPNTRISAGPPEATDSGYRVNLFWFGWDDDGFVDHYEIAWETPENWIGPIFTNDSLFSVLAAESCCVTPLPDFGPQSSLQDSVYEQFHTFYVRAVDNNGVADPTPAVRSFNAKTIAPFTTINPASEGGGPADGGLWGPSVEFAWTGGDEDGVVVSYERALVTKEQYSWDTGRPFETQAAIAWIDTLTYYPVGPSQRKDSLPWEYTEVDSVVYPGVSEFDSQGADALYLFAVRATDDAGAKEQILTAPANVRRFFIDPAVAGPAIFLNSNSAGVWSTTTSNTRSRAVFAGQGLRFSWRASPGRTQSPVAGFSYAVEDTANWTPFSANSVEWPVQVPDEPEVLWFPPEGPHRFFVRVIDEGGFVSVLQARLDVYGGPKQCAPDPDDDTVLVVLDTNPRDMEEIGIWPPEFEQLETALVDYWFDGFNYQVFLSDGGQRPLEIGILNCATSTVWFVSADLSVNSNLFKAYHTAPPNPLASYVAAGGNLFVIGLTPVEAMRWFERAQGSPELQRNFPVNFARTLTDSTFVPHWAATRFGIQSITASEGGSPVTRLRIAKAAVPGYPDLPFDPLTWPEGPTVRGFGFFDSGVTPVAGASEVIYRANTVDGPSLGVRRLNDPQVGGSTVYLGFHPYFVERPAFRELVRAVLTSFGETFTP